MKRRSSKFPSWISSGVIPTRYCMMGYYVDAPVDWCCEEFDIGKGIMFSSSGLEIVHYEGPRLPTSEKICQSTVQPKKHSKFPGGHHINWEKEVRTGKMRYLHVEEALGLSSSIKKYGSPRINTVISRVLSTKSMATVARGIIGKPRAQISNSFREKSKLQPPLGSTGSFEFVPGMLNSCIQAHPSFRARRKVYEFSSLLPDTLKFELDRRGNIWESLFNNHILGKEDIGLYFFASEKERKSTDVRLATIAIGTANHGGLAKLSIQENNICRGVTDICLKDIARGCHLN
uniref:EIN3-binding F-box protein 1 n=1 Tax=Solanum tuberosum TaxID=4113 RepID=M1C4I2_SOLTU